MKRKQSLSELARKVCALLLTMCLCVGNCSVVNADTFMVADGKAASAIASSTMQKNSAPPENGQQSAAGVIATDISEEMPALTSQHRVLLAAVEPEKPLIEKSGKTKPAESQTVEKIPNTAGVTASEPEQPVAAETAGSSNTWIYAGLGVAAVGALALGLSGGGGGSSSSTEPEETTEEPVGADIAGSNWAGTLTLYDGEREFVSATITQKGDDITITTSATQKYGKKFIGTINASAHITVVDQTTGEKWTTSEGAANWNSIELFDPIATDETKMDELRLFRSSK